MSSSRSLNRPPALRACHLPHAVKAPVSLLRTPPLSVVAAVVDAIQAQGAVAAVGGSGLLAALGLVGRVRDWDVTTDAETETVEAALRATGLPVAPAPAGEGSYATRARFVVPCADHTSTYWSDSPCATTGAA